MQEFRLSFIVTFFALAGAAFWGWQQGGLASAAQACGYAAILAVMEISLSFDNAVVNASILQQWNARWRQLFMTLGMLVAVFGMRLLFPLLIVAVATGQGLPQVWHLALDQPQQYAQQLHAHHAEVAAFGAAFLLLVFLQFLFDEEKETHWFRRLEAPLSVHGSTVLSWLLVLLVVWAGSRLTSADRQAVVLLAGVAGIATHAAVGLFCQLLEMRNPGTLATGSIGGFLYLELLDASFSFDGVIGAFAITQDIVLIMLGLACGAMFVRSLTIYLVKRGTLRAFIYLEHGAHYAIGVLALLMLASVRFDVPEWLTGLSGLVFIGLALYSSQRHRRRHPPAA